MSGIPVYLKTDADAPRPADPVFYWVTRDGAFLCRNHPFFASDAPARRPVRSLAAHAPAVSPRYPKVPSELLEAAVGFFDRVFALHRSEAVVLLMWDLAASRYRLLVPEQEASVWVRRDGSRSPDDVRYQVPVPPPGCLLAGDIHSHGDMAAYSSATDRADEVYRDGIHAVVGRIEEDPPEFHLELDVDGHRFPLEFGDVFGPFRRRHRSVPRSWIDKVSITERRSAWGWSSADWRGWQAGYE